jgi:hypothetical protein
MSPSTLNSMFQEKKTKLACNTIRILICNLPSVLQLANVARARRQLRTAAATVN